MPIVLVSALATGGCAHKPAPVASGPKPDSAFSELVPAAAPSPAAAALHDSPAFQPPPPRSSETPKNTKLLVTPEKGLAGKVVSFNAAGRFVVLNFPVGHLPDLDQQLSVYRQGLKVGEVKTTNLRNDDYVVADVVAGEAAAGDQVRDR